MTNSREKGKKGERELARQLRDYGYDTRRGQQFSGANGDADVVGLPGIHIEVKRAEQCRIYDWIQQAVRDARQGETPAVFWRKSRAGWLVTMRLEDWIRVYEGREEDG